MRQRLRSPRTVAAAALVVGLLVAAVAFATGLAPAASATRTTPPTGFDGYMVFMATGSFPATEPALVGAEGERFHREVMGRSDAEIAEQRATAVARFEEQYGLDFSASDRAGGAMFGPFVMNPGYDYRLYSMAGQDVPAEGWEINDGGFLFMTTEPTTIYGAWGGPEGTAVPAGTVAMVGDYRIDRMVGGELDPLVFSYRDAGPMVPDDAGHFYFRCEIQSAELGEGLIQGVWAPEEMSDGRMRANTRTVVTFPPGVGDIPDAGESALASHPATIDGAGPGSQGHAAAGSPGHAAASPPGPAAAGAPVGRGPVSPWVLLSLTVFAALVALAFRLRPTPASQPSRSSTGWVLWVAVLGVIVFQVVHLGEHFAQGLAWLVNPGQTYVTPWAASGADGLRVLTTGAMSAGMEMLHLLGNMVFLAGLAALVALTARLGVHDLRWLRPAVAVQAVHVLEHSLLTLTSIVGGRALGLSNMFGLVDPQTTRGMALRVWVHLSWNLIGTVLAVLAIREIVHRVSPPALRDRVATSAAAAPIVSPAR